MWLELQIKFENPMSEFGLFIQYMQLSVAVGPERQNAVFSPNDDFYEQSHK